MNVEAGNKPEAHASKFQGPIFTLKYFTGKRKIPKEGVDYSAVEGRINTKNIAPVPISAEPTEYLSEGTLLNMLSSYLSKPFQSAEEILGSDYGKLDEDKRKNRLMRAKSFKDILLDLEKQTDWEKTCYAAKILYSTQLYGMFLSGTIISAKENKTCLIPASLSAKILECIIASKPLCDKTIDSMMQLCQRAILENTLINRTTNLDKIKQFSLELQKIKTPEVSSALISLAENHPDLFVDEARTNSFMSSLGVLSSNPDLDLAGVVSFISTTETGLWKLITENRIPDFSRNAYGYVLVHTAVKKPDENDIASLVRKNIGPYYSGKDSEKIIGILSACQEAQQVMVKSPEGFITLKEAPEKNLITADTFKVLEFKLKPLFAVREATYYKQKPANNPLALEANGFYSSDWTCEPSYWTTELRKAHRSICQELQKKQIQSIVASKSAYSGKVSQGCVNDELTVWVKAKETDLPKTALESLIKQSINSRGICLENLKIEIIYKEKTDESIRCALNGEDEGLTISYVSKQEGFKKKTTSKKEEVIVWFNGKSISSLDYIKCETGNLFNSLANVFELSLNDMEKKEHFHTAFTIVEDLLKDNQEAFKDLLTEALQSWTGNWDETKIYASALAKISGAKDETILEMMKACKETDRQILPDNKGNIWYEHLNGPAVKCA